MIPYFNDQKESTIKVNTDEDLLRLLEEAKAAVLPDLLKEYVKKEEVRKLERRIENLRKEKREKEIKCRLEKIQAGEDEDEVFIFQELTRRLREKSAGDEKSSPKKSSQSS